MSADFGATKLSKKDGAFHGKVAGLSSTGFDGMSRRGHSVVTDADLGYASASRSNVAGSTSASYRTRRERMSYERFIAIRHLQSRGSGFVSTITVIAILGVFLGVASLTSVLAVTGGFQQAFQDRVLGVNSHIIVRQFGSDFRDYREVQQTIEDYEEVVATSPFIFHEMIGSHGGRTAGILVKGIEPSTAAEVSDIPQYTQQEGVVSDLEFDRFPDDGQVGVPRILIGESLAERLDVEPGDTLQLTSPLEGMQSGGLGASGGRPSIQRFEIAGTYRSGFHEYDDRMVLTDFRALQEFFDQGDTVTGVDVRVHDVFGVGQLTEQFREQLPETDYQILDWRELNHNLFTSLGLQRIVLAVLFCFIVLVASFNIVCTLIMIVLEKNKEIAILKSMGATNGEIMKTFMYQGTIIGLVGTVNGLIGGLVICLLIRQAEFGLDAEIYMIDHLPVRLVFWEFALVGVLAMIICVLATIGPSWWAAKMDPVDGLRYD